MTQPLLGICSAVLMMALALGLIAIFDLATFLGWVSFIAMCFIPMSIVAGITWGANPPFAARLRQPAKGVVLTLTTAVAAAVMAPLLLRLVGEGVAPPGPIPSHFAVVAVVFTFWAAIMMGGWPLTAVFKGSVLAGLAVLAAAYAVTWIVFRTFFDYTFMQGAPVYLASAPDGLYMAILALVFCVTHVAAMFLVLCFDLWPLTTAPAVMQQPRLGVVWTLTTIVLTAVATWAGIGLGGMDPMTFLTSVSVPFIFGAILVLNMFQNSLFAAFTQPVLGVLNVAVAAILGVALARVYGWLGPLISGPLASGPPQYDYEVWLANALLGITFPLLVFHAVFFDFWPLKRDTAMPGGAAR
jgi:hypothetical protein